MLQKKERKKKKHTILAILAIVLYSLLNASSFRIGHRKCDYKNCLLEEVFTHNLTYRTHLAPFFKLNFIRKALHVLFINFFIHS